MTYDLRPAPSSTIPISSSVKPYSPEASRSIPLSVAAIHSHRQGTCLWTAKKP
jgi:hypothetical protein